MQDGKTKYWFTLKDVFTVLRSRGILFTWTQLKRYQKAKLIPPFNNVVLFRNNKEMPIFTTEDINNLVNTITEIKIKTTKST